MKKHEKITEPPVLICYICGGKYGTASLKFHLKACKPRFILEEQTYSSFLRVALPDPPKELEDFMANPKSQKLRRLYNEKATQMSEKTKKWMCDYCGRTFFKNRIAIHQQGCSKEKPLTSPREIKGKKSDYRVISKEIIAEGERKLKEKIANVKTLNCYLCGLEYGTKSLRIHLTFCKQRFLREAREMASENELSQIKLPEPPEELVILSEQENMDPALMQIYNKNAMEICNEHTTGKCKYCGRTFFLQQLQKHLKLCGPGRPQKRTIQKSQPQMFCREVPKEKNQDSRIATAGAFKKPTAPGFKKKPIKTVYCYMCFQEYSLNSIEYHLKSCRFQFLNRQSVKPQTLRHFLPQTPKQLKYINQNFEKLDEDQLDTEILNYNQLAMQIFEESNYDRCKYSGKLVPPERLDIVQRVYSDGQSEREPKLKKPSHMESTRWVKQQMNKYRQRKKNEKFEEFQFDIPAQLSRQLMIQCGYCKRSFSREQIYKHRKVCQEYQMVLIASKKGVKIERVQQKNSGISKSLSENLFAEHQMPKPKLVNQKLMLESKNEPIIKEIFLENILPKNGTLNYTDPNSDSDEDEQSEIFYNDQPQSQNEEDSGQKIKSIGTSKIPKKKSLFKIPIQSKTIYYPQVTNMRKQEPPHSLKNPTIAQQLRMKQQNHPKPKISKYIIQTEDQLKKQSQADLKQMLLNQTLQRNNQLQQLMQNNGNQNESQLLRIWNPILQESTFYQKMQKSFHEKNFGNDQMFQEPISSQCEIRM